MRLKQLAGILMMILGFWLFLIPIYVGWKTFKDENILSFDKSTSDLIKLIFAWLSGIIPGIILLVADLKK